MIQSFLACLLLLVPQTFQVENQELREAREAGEARKYEFDQQIVKPLELDLTFEDKNGSGGRMRRKGGRGRKVERRGSHPRLKCFAQLRC